MMRTATETRIHSDIALPEGPSAQYLRTLVPKAIKGMVLGPGSLNIGYLDPLALIKINFRAASYQHSKGPFKGPHIYRNSHVPKGPSTQIGGIYPKP